MKFTVERLREVANEESDILEKVVDAIVGQGRWTVQHEMIFKVLDKFGKHYRTYFNRGATESCEQSPYEYDSGLISCQEVEQKEVTIKQWVKVED